MTHLSQNNEVIYYDPLTIS